MKQETVDVAIIGSGIGGLSAAALLAHAGYKTLVAERLPRIGGRFSTIDYQGYKITTGAYAAHIGGEFEQIFKEVGADFDVRRVDEIVYRIRGTDYDLSEKGSLKKLLEIAGGDQAEAQKVMTALRRAINWKVPSSRGTFREWLLQYTDNEGILELFDGFLRSQLGGTIDELSANQFIDLMLATGGMRDHALLPQGAIALAESLAKVVRESGGDVWTRCKAKRILSSDQVVNGVVVEREGQEVEIAAQAVISNIGPKNTVTLAGSDNFDKGYLREVWEKSLSTRCTLLHISSDRPLSEHYGSMVFVGTHRRRLQFAIFPTQICPEYAPPGMHLMLAGGTLFPAHLPVNLEDEIECLVEDVRENFPAFDKHGRVLLAGIFQKDWPVFRGWPGYFMPTKTPIELLYNVGDGVLRPGMFGGHGAAQSGKIVAEDIKERVRPGYAEVLAT